MDKPAKKTPTTAAPLKKKGALPSVVNHTLDYFSREEAKISSKGVVTGALTLVALGFLGNPVAHALHTSYHASFSSHTNQAAVNTHSSVAGINQHTSASAHANAAAATGHYSLANHSNKPAVNAHNSVSNHTNANVVGHSNTPATNVTVKAAVDAQVTKGSF
ncbi:MAG TPA: hypothetical protein PLK80_09290, partial [bacterium]|nr:hypothetical protein [bacterium]